MLAARAMPLAAVLPMSNDEARPGPEVAATALISAIVMSADSKALSTSGRRRSEWLRDASSGTTPPNSR